MTVSRSATRRSSSPTARSTRAPYGRRGRPTRTSSRTRDRRSWNRRSRSTDSASQKWRWPASSSGLSSWRSAATRQDEARSPVPTRPSASCTTTSCGRSATTSSPCRRIARSATSGWAGRETPRRSPRPHRRSSMPSRSGGAGCATSRSNRTPRSVSRRSCRTSSSMASRASAGPAGPTPRRSCRGRCTRRAATRASSRPSSRAWPHRWTPLRGDADPTACFRPRCSSATGSIRTLRRIVPGNPRRTRPTSPTPSSPIAPA